MLKLQIANGQELLFVDPQAGTRFGVTFLRTLRVPDDGRRYPLPPGMGPLPIRDVREFQGRVPVAWLRHPGVLVPLYLREAVWLAFRRGHAHPNAVKLAAGRVNAISGRPFGLELRPPAEPGLLQRWLGQPPVPDYVVCPPQVWFDGFHTEPGTVRQLVVVPLGHGHTVEAQVTGREEHGGLQLVVYEPKPGRFPAEPMLVDAPAAEASGDGRAGATGSDAPDASGAPPAGCETPDEEGDLPTLRVPSVPDPARADGDTEPGAEPTLRMEQTIGNPREQIASKGPTIRSAAPSLPPPAGALQTLVDRPPSEELPHRCGPYRVLDRIAVSDVAEFLLAQQLELQPGEAVSKLVIKRYLPAVCADDSFVIRLQTAARLAATLHHANLGQVHEVGELEGRIYLVQEYIDGKDLRRILDAGAKRQKPLLPAESVLLVAQVADGLHHAHTRIANDQLHTLIHGGISPRNIMISFDGEVKLLDFGIARPAGPWTRTQNDAIKGMLTYMSPEQARGKELDGRSDLFSLGICLWELVTGQRLFFGETEFETLSRVLKAEIPSVSEFNAGVHPKLDQIIRTALARDPDQRFNDLGKFKQALMSFFYQHCDPDTIDLGEYLRWLHRQGPVPRSRDDRAPPPTITASAYRSAAPVRGFVAPDPDPEEHTGRIDFPPPPACPIAAPAPASGSRLPRAPAVPLAGAPDPTLPLEPYRPYASALLAAPGCAPQAQSGKRPRPTAAQDLGLAAGGRIAQKIYPDPYGLNTWDDTNFGWVFVHLVSPADWRAITGESPPPTPVSAHTYTAAGLPWFQVYDDDLPDSSVAPVLASIRSLAQLDREPRIAELDDEPLRVGVVVAGRPSSGRK